MATNIRWLGMTPGQGLGWRLLIVERDGTVTVKPIRRLPRLAIVRDPKPTPAA